MPYADPDRQRQAKRESARRRREAARVADDPRARFIADLREQAAAGCVIAEIVLRRRFGIDITIEGSTP